MYRRVITWTRPSDEFAWPWDDAVSNETIDGLWGAMVLASGFLGKSNVTDTLNEIANNNDWASWEDWNNYNNDPTVVALHATLDSILATSNITRTITEVYI